MKYLLLALLLSSCARNNVKRETSVSIKNIPDAVKTAFSHRHPDVKTNFHLQTIDDEPTYEVHLGSPGMDISERYSKEGNLIEIEEEVKLSDIPEPVRNDIQTYLRDKDSSRIQKIQKTKSADFDGYEIRCKTSESKTGVMEYFFERDGKFHHADEVELESIHNLN